VHVYGGRARTPARRGRARLRGARTHVGRACTPAGARTSARVGRAHLRGGGRARLRGGRAWSSLFFGSFAPHLQIKLGIHASNVNSRFVIMSELELSFLMGVLTPYFNTMDLEKNLKKNKNFTFRS
jgi:hypothetical protein